MKSFFARVEKASLPRFRVSRRELHGRVVRAPRVVDVHTLLVGQPPQFVRKTARRLDIVVAGCAPSPDQASAMCCRGYCQAWSARFCRHLVQAPRVRCSKVQSMDLIKGIAVKRGCNDRPQGTAPRGCHVEATAMVLAAPPARPQPAVALTALLWTPRRS